MPKFSIDDINVLHVDACLDKSSSTRIKETENLLQYESQHFRCQMQVEVQESIAEQDWIIGLVQACDKMYLENKYGNVGSSHWEFHPLKSKRHKVVNDSDGRQYPFYSQSNSKFEINKGPVSEKKLLVQFEDHFYPTVAWELPYTENQKLTEIIRHQAFWVWLVAIKKGSSEIKKEFYDIKKDELYILKTVRWKYDLQMSMNPRNPVGKRVTGVYDFQRESPQILDCDKPMPMSATSPPHCNAAQSLTWYPSDSIKRPKILVPPRQIVVPWEMWLTDMFPNRDMKVMHPKDCKLVGAWKRDFLIESPFWPTTDFPTKTTRLVIPSDHFPQRYKARV